MARRRALATDAEWGVLEQLWEQGPAPVRRLAETLYPGGGASEYATVHRFLERLEAKGYVRRERMGGVYLFRPAIERDAVIGEQLETLMDKMGGGSLQPLLTHLVRARRVSRAELRELLELVDRLDAGRRRRKDR